MRPYTSKYNYGNIANGVRRRDTGHGNCSPYTHNPERSHFNTVLRTVTCIMRVQQVPLGDMHTFPWITKLTVKCWNNHALKMLVATLGNMPRFFWFFFPFVSSSSSPVPSPLPILALLASPETKQCLQANQTINNLLHVAQSRVYDKERQTADYIKYHSSTSKPTNKSAWTVSLPTSIQEISGPNFRRVTGYTG